MIKKVVLSSLLFIALNHKSDAQDVFIFPSAIIENINDSLLVIKINDFVWGRELETEQAGYTISGKIKDSKDTVLLSIKLDPITQGKLLNVNNEVYFKLKNNIHPDEIKLSRYVTQVDKIIQTNSQNISIQKNQNGLVALEVFTLKTINNNKVPVQKVFYNYETDSIWVKLNFKATNPLANITIILSVTQGSEGEIRKRVKTERINFGDEIKFDIGLLPKSFQFGGKVYFTIEVFNSDKQMLFNFEEIPVLVRGSGSLDKIGSTESIDPYGFQMYSDEEFETIYNISDYFADSQERMLIRGLVAKKDKLAFLNKFWNKREINDLKYLPNFQELRNRLQICSEMRLGKQGRYLWKSERVRVLLIYGIPDQIDKEPFGKNSYSIEKWYYNKIENSVEFVFIDISKDNDYRLIHSSKSGEVFNPNYQIQYEKTEEFE